MTPLSEGEVTTVDVAGPVQARHTTGPYKAEYMPHSDTWIIYGADGYDVAILPNITGKRRKFQMAADAHLMAASEDLFEALSPFITSKHGEALPDDKTAPSVCFLNVTIGDIRRAQAAYKKAKGLS